MNGLYDEIFDINSDFNRGYRTAYYFVGLLLLPVLLLVFSCYYKEISLPIIILILIISWSLLVSLWVYYFKLRDKNNMQEKQDMMDSEDTFYRNYFRNKKNK